MVCSNGNNRPMNEKKARKQRKGMKKRRDIKDIQ